MFSFYLYLIEFGFVQKGNPLVGSVAVGIFDIILIYLIYRLITFKPLTPEELESTKKEEEYWKSNYREIASGEAPVKME